ncbi:MAG: sulfite exporter TauE/SafE family protein [Fimbriimonadaceae bacterium]|nr:sulfite exporter TauE/SafE family protein [Alphaproteobacteria bacterium]
MFEIGGIIFIGLTFLLAGMVKGVIGFGLPTISLAVLATTFGLPVAMALMLVPSFVTNVWQAMTGGQGVKTLKRIWPFLLAATATVWIGALALSRIDFFYLSALLGVLVAVYAGLNLLGMGVRVRREDEGWLGPLFGLINGLLTGMTGAFVFPGILYLQALGFSRDALIQAMGMLFMASTIALTFSLGVNDFLTFELGLWSAAGIVPAIAGMIAGQRIRAVLSENLFRRMFFLALLALGVFIIAKALL